MSASPQIDAEVFSADAQVMPSTANAKDGTIDVVWYSGAFVPRIDRSTGEPYMLKLDMQGCRLDRLNNGAPVFDTHFTGDDFKSLIAGKVGTRAQVGVVRRAWPNGDKGMATLQFDLGDPDGAEMFRKASTGILQNLSFGTFIYKREKIEAQTEGMPEGKPPYLNNKEIGMFKATDWEPFEISPCTVPADFNTCFLSAQPNGRGHDFRHAGFRRDRCSTGNQPNKGETCNAGNYHAGNGRGCPCSERTGLGRRAGRGGPGRTAARQRDSSRWALSQPIRHRRGRHQRVHRQGRVRRSGPEGDRSTSSRQRASRTLNGERVPDSRRGRRLGDSRRHGAVGSRCMQMALLLRADGAVLPGAPPRPQRQRPRRVPRRLRSRRSSSGPPRWRREYRNFKLIDMAKEVLCTFRASTRAAWT